jgi:anaphase-promoting complex subunit 2
MSPAVLNPRKKRVFDSVFRGPPLSQPTPVVTPVGGFTSPGQAFGAPAAFVHDRRQAPLSAVRSTRLTDEVPVSESNHVRDQVQWDRSWHTVTHALVPPDVPSSPELIEAWEPEFKTPDAAFVEAMRDVLDPSSRLPYATHTEGIVVWHTNQVRYHFLRQVLPIIQALNYDGDPEVLLLKVIGLLSAAHRPYLAGMSIILRTLETIRPEASRGISQRFRRDLHAMISHSVTESISGALKTVLRHHVFNILGVPTAPGPENVTVPTESYITEKSRAALLTLVGLLQEVGLAGERFQITFAEIMNDAMTEYVSVGCRGVWSAEDAEARGQHNAQAMQGRKSTTGLALPRTALHSPASQCVTDLCEWIENGYARLAVQVFHALGPSQTNHVDINWRQVERWKEMGIGHLGSLRTDELFDIVGNWPHTTAALADLRTAITTPQRRLHLTEVFSLTMGENLLHPGASTLQILQTYISMISSFHALDHSKVLLDRVAYPLQLYLCSRDDTVRIIITGLLADTEDAQGNAIGPGGDKLVELALLLNKGEEQVGQKANDDELDWHDPDWIPDPIDAGPGYKRSKNADILGTLIGVLGSQDVFIKEFQNIIGEHLLKNEGGFEKEVGHYLPG